MAKRNGENRVSSKHFKKDKYVGTSQRLEGILGEVLSKLRGRGNLQMLEQAKISQETLINATWLCLV